MHASDLVVIHALDQLIRQAEQFVVELQAYSVTPASAVRAAEEVAAGFHRKRRTMLEEMMLDPVGTC